MDEESGSKVFRSNVKRLSGYKVRKVESRKVYKVSLRAPKGPLCGWACLFISSVIPAHAGIFRIDPGITQSVTGKPGMT